MRAAVCVSIILGLLWNVIAVSLIGGRLRDALEVGWVAGGALAGLVAGCFTVWSRKRTDGHETFAYGFATYYLGIVTYWASFVLIERVRLCLQHGGWTGFDLRDHLILIYWYLMLGTLPYGLILIPLNFLSRYVVWRVYRRHAASKAKTV